MYTLDTNAVGHEDGMSGTGCNPSCYQTPAGPFRIKLRPVTMASSRERVHHIGLVFLHQLATRSAFSFLFTQQLG